VKETASMPGWPAIASPTLAPWPGINRIARADKLSAGPKPHRSPRTARDAMTAQIRNVGELLANHLTERGILVEDPTPVTETRSRIEGIPGPWPLDPGGAAPR
jgi:hypothetical protein